MGPYCELPMDDWKLNAANVPADGCKKKAPRTAQARWEHGGKLAAAISADSPSPPCKPLISVALFDQKGKARLRLHTDLVSAPAFTVLGDKCQNVEFTHDEKTSGFIARPTKCKP